jgi:hypothetical protein
MPFHNPAWMSAGPARDDEDAFVTPERSGTKHRETCRKCNGRGSFIGYSGRNFGQCFECKGRGFKEFVQAPEARAKARVQRADRKAKSIEAQRTWFAEAHPEVWAWIQSSRATFEFAESMAEAIDKFGDLTERQLEACERAVEKRNAARKAREEAKANAPVVSADKLMGAFDAAVAKGLKRPVMRFDGFSASLAPATGKNAGAVYLKGFDGEYWGKIAGGRFQASRECSREASEAVQAAMADPLAAAVAYGRRTGQCSCCGRELTNAESVELGIGPICRERFGL